MRLIPCCSLMQQPLQCISFGGLGEWAEVEGVAGAVGFVGPDQYPGLVEQVGHECHPCGWVDESSLAQFGGDGAAVEGVEECVEGVQGCGDGGVGAGLGE